MVTCSLCKQQHVAYITIGKLNICSSCAKEEGIHSEDLRTCTNCLCITSKFHGCEEENGFICSTCLQEEHEYAVEEFINDPKHKGVPIEELFTEAKRTFVIKALTTISYILGVLIHVLKTK